jgi:hypothetical protein
MLEPPVSTDGMPMFDELAALSSPECLWLNALGLICLAAFALVAITGLGGGTKLKRYWLVIAQSGSGYRVGRAAAPGG